MAVEDGYADAGELAGDLASILESGGYTKEHGWTVEGLDIGEVEIRFPNGQFARLTVELFDEEPA
jgi:hypothetical protein